MPAFLVLFAGKHGHTAKVAARIAAGLEAGGARADLCDVAAGPPPAPQSYDAVVAGASIHAGHYPRAIVDWACEHRTTLSAMPSAFFSVCLTAADDTSESRTTTRGYIDGLLEATGWIPRTTTTFAGALQYREYDFATRLLVRLIMRKQGMPTDVSHDVDYTDWDAVDGFARTCAGLLERTPAQP